MTGGLNGVPSLFSLRIHFSAEKTRGLVNSYEERAGEGHCRDGGEEKGRQKRGRDVVPQCAQSGLEWTRFAPSLAVKLFSHSSSCRNLLYRSAAERCLREFMTALTASGLYRMLNSSRYEVDVSESMLDNWWRIEGDLG